MAIIDTLKSMGIDEKQAQVYLACLELGKGTIQEVSLKSGVKRTSIYNFLEEMKNKGLVSEVKEGKKVVLIAEDPNNLALKMQRQSDEFKMMLPELMGIFNLPSHKPKVKFYQGVEGIKNAYGDLLTAQSTIYGFADYEKMFYLIDALSIWRIPEERAKRKIKYLNIAKDSPTARDVKKRDGEQLRETRLVKDVDFETEINIYDNKVAMFSFRRPGAAVIIEDAAIAQTLRSIWKAWWNTLPKN